MNCRGRIFYFSYFFFFSSSDVEPWRFPFSVLPVVLYMIPDDLVECRSWICSWFFFFFPVTKATPVWRPVPVETRNGSHGQATKRLDFFSILLSFNSSIYLHYCYRVLYI